MNRWEGVRVKGWVVRMNGWVSVHGGVTKNGWVSRLMGG